MIGFWFLCIICFSFLVCLPERRKTGVTSCVLGSQGIASLTEDIPRYAEYRRKTVLCFEDRSPKDLLVYFACFQRSSNHTKLFLCGFDIIRLPIILFLFRSLLLC